MERKVVVTGLGVVSPLGHELERFWHNILNGQCGIRNITAFDASKFGTRIAAEVQDFDPNPAFPSPKEVRRTDRFSQFGVYAAYQALKDSGLDLEQMDRDTRSAFLSAPASAAFIPSKNSTKSCLPAAPAAFLLS